MKTKLFILFLKKLHNYKADLSNCTEVYRFRHKNAMLYQKS